MYIYFRNIWEQSVDNKLIKEELLIKKKLCPIGKNKSLKENIVIIYWHIASFFCGDFFYEYQLIVDDKVVSYARVVPKILIFSFIPKGGYHIGPCLTLEEYRGNGFYPLLLSYIIKKNVDKDFYMIVDENNIASIKGVKKAGFEEFARGKKNKFGRYVIV